MRGTVSAGTTAPPSALRRGRARSAATRTAVGVLALGLTAASLTAMTAEAINSNPPTGPGNIEIFPMRDMVAIEGYTEQAGMQATITALRGTQVIGKTTGTVGADGFLEANHPGGVCWGVGTGAPQVTPDLQQGDEIKVDFSNGQWDGSKVVDIAATGVDLDEDAHTLTINGRYGPGVDMPNPADLTGDPGKVGVEIVNPEMRNGSAIGERAIGWPNTEATPGYDVVGSVTGTDAAGGTFAVKYTFQNDADLELANAGSITALGWLANHPDPNQEAQYGLTLNEFYEFGGPGMGGCPAGPTLTRTNGPGTYSALGAGDGSITVNWADAVPVPGTPAVTGYTVRAVADNKEDEVGKRLDNTSAAKETTTLTGLVPDHFYTIEIAAKSAAGEGTPAVSKRIKASPHVTPTATATTSREPNADGKYAPLVSNRQGDFGVYLDPEDGVVGAEVHYTLDGSTPSLQSRTFAPGDPALDIRQDTTVRWIVVDSGNIVGPEGKRFFDIVESTNPAPEITKVTATAASGAVDVTWNKLTGEGENLVEAYRVQAYTGASADAASGIRVGDPVGAPQPTDATATEVTRRITGLTNGTTYKFTVAARYGTVFSVESALSAAVAPEAAAGANAGADQKSLRNRVVTLDGSASSKAVSYEWTQVRPAPVAPATYRDPMVTLTGATTANPTFTFPAKTSAASDDNTYEFRLLTKHANADGTTVNRNDTVVVTATNDPFTVSRPRWRAGDTMTGTGTTGARLSFHSGSHTGPVVVATTVANGAWSVPGSNTLPTGGKFYIWSTYGYVGEITVTR